MKTQTKAQLTVPLPKQRLLCIQTILAVGIWLGASMYAEAKSSQSGFRDPDIAHAVDLELQIDPIVSAHMIDITATNGIITLSGTVDNLLSRERAIRIAKTLRGVRAVIDKLSVKSIERPDSEIVNDIRSALRRDPATDSYEIFTQVKDGVAALSGTVQSWQERELAARVAKGIKGVREVNNKISWQPVTSRPDTEIRRDIEQRLRANVWVDSSLVETTVKQGDVTLTGTVGSAIEKSWAHQIAWVTGTRTVDASGLKVEDWARDRRKRRPAALPADTEVEQAIALAFVHDPRVNPFNPEIDVAAGVVTLTGQVDNLKARQAAEADARNTVGVIAVENRLKVRPKSALTDSEVAEAVRQALASDPYVDGYEIGVSVVNRKVYLSGTVDSFFEKSQATDLVARVNGVAAVENALSVNPAPPSRYSWQSQNNLWQNAVLPFDLPPMSRDRAVEERIEDQLFWSPYVDGDDIEVNVRNGVATLKGTVDSRMERGAAVDNAYQGGAISVNNQLKLETGS